MTAKKTEKKKLLIATDNFLPRWDGVSRFLSEIIPRLKKNHTITVICPDYGENEFDFDKEITFVKMSLSKLKIGDYTPAKIDNKEMKKQISKTDVIFTQTIGPIGNYAISQGKKKRKKIVSFIHSIEWELAAKATDVFFFKKYIYLFTKMFSRHIYKKPNMLIVPSESVAELLSWQKIDTKKSIIHLGVDTKKFVFPIDKAKAKENLGIDKDAFVIGNHGRIAREKDPLTLLRAFVLFKKKYPNSVLLMVGDGLESLKSKFSKVPGVMLVGSTNNVIPFLQAMDVYALSSLTETTSLATLEAMACGAAVISTRVGFVKYYIRNGFNGLFFSEKNSYELFRKFEYLSQNPNNLKKLVVNSRKTVEKDFDWDNTAKKIEKVIEKIMG
jgi:glycosyltransferase involved in cell wall biosynthesis